MARRPWTRGLGSRGRGNGRKAQAPSRKPANSKKRAAPWPTSSDGEDERSSVSDARKKVRWNSNADERSTQLGQDSDDAESEQFVCAFVGCWTTVLKRVGCAYFDSTNGVLYLLEDTQDGSHYDFTKQLLEQTDPDYVIMSSKADEKFITVCREFMSEKSRGWQVRPHREFTVAKGKEKLYSLPLLSDIVASGGIPSSESGAASRSAQTRDAYDFMDTRAESAADPALTRWQASIRVANFIEAERSPLCMACVGGLLEHLHRTRAFGALGDDAPHLVNTIEILRLNQAMHINMDALLSLQIFEEENHASMHSDKTKEGLSLFGTLNYTRTRAGYDLLRQWFLRPSLSLEVIAARHNAIACFLHSDNLTISGALRTNLKGVRNVPHLLLAMKKGKSELRSWVTLCSFVFHSAMIAEALEGLADAEDVEVVRRLNENFASATFTEMGEDIHKIIDLDESALQGRVCVKPAVDAQLDELKETYDRLDSNNISVQIAAEVPHDVVPALNVVYFPQLGFLISVPLPEGWNSEEPLFGVPDWSYQFNTESSVFFKSSKMRDLDHHIGDIQTIIAEIELEIVHALSERVMPYAPAIEATCAILAELDCLLSFAQASLVQGYMRPLMSEENVLAVRGGRHPLHEQVVDTFIPNDAFLIGGAGTGVAEEDDDEEDPEEEPPAHEATGILEQKGRSVMVITGANACGKSVYLKQVALIQYMAQVTSFVPAESATLGVVDKIFTRVQARESISKVQSSFMIDLNQVSLALRNTTARSLVLLDEFGKGTLDTDGAGLLVGVLRHLLARGADCPKVLATTHFRDVFRADIVPRTLPLALAHMRIMLVQQQGDESIVYLYQVASGLSLESHAAKCAAVCGLPKAVVQRAQYVTERVAQHEVGALLDEQMTPEEQEELRGAEDVFRRFVALNFGDNDDEDGEEDTRAKLRHVLGLPESAPEREADEDEH
ncbi:hypothetical protein AURDEDRAFT_135210 [Auricularia subglabra TFB-10046 SS5]|nr:hypothetical protein AURDEDRAFT_135210 [Auricularia subglabra TFB-10046 SS5]